MRVEWIEDNLVFLQKLTPKEAADPSILSGAVIKMSNELDQLLVIGDDVWKLGPKSGDWHLGHKLPQKEADLLLGWLRLEEK
jgi:hypothetical protein